MPRKVFHLTEPVETSIAYSYPSQEPTYATPPTIAGWEATGPPVAIDQRFVNKAACPVSMPVSLLTPSRWMSCKDVGQSSVAWIAAVDWAIAARNVATISISVTGRDSNFHLLLWKASLGSRRTGRTAAGFRAGDWG